MKPVTILSILAVIAAIIFAFLWWKEKQKLAGKSYWYDEAVYTKRGNDTVVILRMKNLSNEVLKSDNEKKIMTEEITDTKATGYLRNYNQIMQSGRSEMQKTYACTFNLIKLLQIADADADEIRVYFGCYTDEVEGHHRLNQLTTFVRGVKANSESGKIANLGKLCPNDCSTLASDAGSIYSLARVGESQNQKQ